LCANVTHHDKRGKQNLHKVKPLRTVRFDDPNKVSDRRLSPEAAAD
jgi:hypothetical protein